MTGRNKRRGLGLPPADWLSSSSTDTRSIGRPPREYGEARASGPLTALVVSEDREVAARVALSLAAARASLRLALHLDEAPHLLDGTRAVFVFVPRFDHPVLGLLDDWKRDRALFALVLDPALGHALRDRFDAVLEPPWGVVEALGALSR